jgi:nucleoside 2-deoxyribosyltransferase
MHYDSLVKRIESLCEERSLPIHRDVKVGPYLAPVVIHARDEAGIGRDVLIAVEPRHWNLSVSKRMAKWATKYLERMQHLTEVDFVAIVVGGDRSMPEGITSLRELADFLNGFSTPEISDDAQAQTGRLRGSPQPTKKYENELLGTLVFCAMPFAAEFDAVFFDMILPAVEQAILVALRTDQEDSLISIDRRIMDGIRRSDIVLADISGHNPNVMYEIGVAHALAKPTLLLKNDGLPLPFDIHYHEIMKYSLNDCGSSKQLLSERLTKGINGLWKGFRCELEGPSNSFDDYWRKGPTIRHH